MEDKGRSLLRLQEDIEKAAEFRRIVQQRIIEDPSAATISLKHEKLARVLVLKQGHLNLYAKVVDKGAGLYLVHQENGGGTHVSKIYTEEELMSID